MVGGVEQLLHGREVGRVDGVHECDEHQVLLLRVLQVGQRVEIRKVTEDGKVMRPDRLGYEASVRKRVKLFQQRTAQIWKLNELGVSFGSS